MHIIHEQTSSPLDTTTYFNYSGSSETANPIDSFIDSVIRINALCKDSKNIESELTHLMLLGFVSAVESYIRSVIRELINTDIASYAASQDKQISYAAATHHSHDLMADALVEHVSFASSTNISEAFINYLGFKKGPTKRAISYFCSDFEKICQLRHCIVHRFGRLGTQNALKLGFNEHSKYLEQSITMTYAELQQNSNLCDNLVRALNNFCFNMVVNRTYHENWINWTGDLRKDKKLFRQYYSIFASVNNKPASPSIRDVYKDFKKSVLSQARNPDNWTNGIY